MDNRTTGARARSLALPDAFAAVIVFVAAAAVLVLETLALRLIAPYVGVTLQTGQGPIPMTLDRSTGPCAVESGVKYAYVDIP